MCARRVAVTDAARLADVLAAHRHHQARRVSADGDPLAPSVSDKQARTRKATTENTKLEHPESGYHWQTSLFLTAPLVIGTAQRKPSWRKAKNAADCDLCTTIPYTRPGAR